MDRDQRRRAEELAEPYGGILSRALLLGLGIDRDAVARQVAADRWALPGHLTVAMHRGPLPAEARLWLAVWEVGRAVAVVDGVSSLTAAGLTGFTESRVHVSVTRNARCSDVENVRIHRVRRHDGERCPGGIEVLPRTRPAVAAVRAAGWAVSDRQAALVLAMTVQQRLAAGTELVRTARAIRTRGRHPFIRQVVQDIADGAHSLGELDFTAMCRRHGIPEPERQVLRRGPHGRIYLDVRWDSVGLVVEIDGSGHRDGLALTSDNLRQNAVTLGRDTVLRFDLLALRLEEAVVMAQVRAGLRGRV